MRILELGKFYPPERGGIETLLKLWCEGFVAAGDEVDCVVANTSARSVDETLGGVRVHRLASHLIGPPRMHHIHATSSETGTEATGARPSTTSS